ncbi:MAG TPA: carbohydrate-binding family 9-like protein [Chitinophagaceae bacterium]|jgi:hypothetical protein|nr:carbohydrate-binding family 9-like protein [Chitinophagaceae bacterium]
MPTLTVPYLEQPLTEGGDAFDAVPDRPPLHRLEEAPWPQFPGRPAVRFAVAYNENFLFLKFAVREPVLRVACLRTHDPVYEDSCVECFIAFDDRGYYNFEFNALGVCLAAFGPEREGRRPLAEALLDGVGRSGTIRHGAPEGCRWELALSLPLAVFSHHPGLVLKGRTARANFYKCGDRLPEPHYLCWAPVDTPEPDFHQPRFFGTLRFP